jgi:selenide,water dikinase
MKRLNRDAGQLAQKHHLRAATDITGYSLMGHGLEMANASGVGFRLAYSRIPFVTCAQKYAEQWTFPGGASDNRAYFGSSVHFDPALSEAQQMLLFDPQTSGGLLMAVPPAQIEGLMADAKKINQPAWIIGEAISNNGIHIIP